MSEAAVLDSLSDVAFLSGLSAEQLQRLAEISHATEFPARTTIFRENDLAKDVYVIVNGKVSLVICQPKVGCRELMEVGDGDLIGWSPLVGRPRLSDTAYTLVPTKVVVIDGDRLMELCRDQPDFGFEFFQRVSHVLATRLSATRTQLMELGGYHLPDVHLESD